VTTFCHCLLQQLAFSELRHLAGVSFPPIPWPTTFIYYWGDLSSELAHFSTNFENYSTNSIALANSTMQIFIAYNNAEFATNTH
jgi:hypothetical protein